MSAFETWINENRIALPQLPGAPPIKRKAPLGQGLDTFISSPTGGALISAGAGLLNASGQRASEDAQRQQSAGQFKASMAQRGLESSQNNQLQRAQSAASLDPLGSSQMYAGQMALMKSLLGNMQSTRSTPSDPGIAAAMGSRPGMGLPTLDAATLDRLYGDLPTQASIAQKQKQIGQVNPNGPSFDLSSIYGKGEGGAANSFDAEIGASKSQESLRQLQQSEEAKAMVQQAMSEDAKTGKKGGSSIWKKLAKIGIIVGGGIATAMTAGAASPLLAAGIGAMSGAASGALDGGWKGALGGAAMGGLTGGIAPGAGSAAKMGLAAAAKEVAKKQALNIALAAGGR